MKGARLLSSEPLVREVRGLAFPAIVHSLLQTLVFVVDRAMLGHHAEASLAGMQIAGPVEWVVWSSFSAFTVATIARVGWHVGAREPLLARYAAWASLGYSVLGGVAVAALTPAILFVARHGAPNASPEAVAAAEAYLTITLAASPLVFVAVGSIAVLQAQGDTRTPLAIGVGTNALHIALNRVLILGAWTIPPMGPRGAAISTAVTFALTGGFALLALTKRDRPVSLRRRSGDAHAFERAVLVQEAREVARVAVPAVLERMTYGGGYLAFVGLIVLLGDASMAANQVLISVESICFQSADGFGIAAAALVAQRLGAGKPEEAHRATRIAVWDAVRLLSTLGLLFLATRRWVLPMFSDVEEVIAIGAMTVPIMALAQPFMATGTVVAEAMRGAGYTRPVLAISGVGASVVRIVCTLTFAIGLGMGLRGAWLGSTVDWAVRAVLLVWVGRSIMKRGPAVKR